MKKKIENTENLDDNKGILYRGIDQVNDPARRGVECHLKFQLAEVSK
jgi:hypothetical protein